MKLAIITAHAGADSLATATESWVGTPLTPGRTNACCFDWSRYHTWVVNGNNGMLPAYQHGFTTASLCHYDILAYLHDDTLIHDSEWQSRVLKEFEDPKVGVVGFGGGLGHGSAEIYRAPYDYHQLGRSHFLSNMQDAENHGSRFTESCDVAVLDGFALIVRGELLGKAGGWPLGTPVGYVGYDYWLCCMARRLGYRIRLVGVPCTHLGGQTFVKLGKGVGEEHWQHFLEAHRYIYDEFRDVLPYSVA